MQLATWIVWENEGNTYKLKSASNGEHQLTVKRADGSWAHLGTGKKDLQAFIDGIRSNPENKVLSAHKDFKPKKRTPKWIEQVRARAKASWTKPEIRERRMQAFKESWARRKGEGV